MRLTGHLFFGIFGILFVSKLHGEKEGNLAERGLSLTRSPAPLQKRPATKLSVSKNIKRKKETITVACTLAGLGTTPGPERACGLRRPGRGNSAKQMPFGGSQHLL